MVSCLCLPSAEVENKTIPLGLVNIAKGTSVGSNFVFNQDHHSLTPRQAGAYFLYIEVNLTCTHKCSDGLLRLQVDDKLHCDVYLKGDKRSVSHKCWTVVDLDGRGLVTQMRVELPKPEPTDWKLEKKGSGLGMFFIGWYRLRRGRLDSDVPVTCKWQLPCRFEHKWVLR